MNSYLNIGGMMSEKKKMLLILVDPSVIHLPDLISLSHPDTKGVRLIRIKPAYWGKLTPIQLYFINDSDIKEFSNLNSFKEFLEIEEI